MTGICRAALALIVVRFGNGALPLRSPDLTKKLSYPPIFLFISAKLEEENGENPASKPAFPSLTPEVVGALGGGAYGVDVGIDLTNFSHVGPNPLEGFLSMEMISSAFSSSASAEILSTPKLIDGWLDLQQELEERKQSDKRNESDDMSLLAHELNQWTRAKK